MTPAAVKTATCQKRQLALSEAALSTIEIRCPLTRIILESQPSIFVGCRRHEPGSPAQGL